MLQIKKGWSFAKESLYYITFGFLLDITEDVKEGNISIFEKVFCGLGNWYMFLLWLTFWFIPRFIWFSIKSAKCLFVGHDWETRMIMYAIPLGSREECQICHKKRNQRGMRF